ncbi:MAG TPA: MarR family transcriptional regulator [Pseudonocardia sp.]
MTTPGHDEVPLPALLRAARRAYGRAVRRALADAGLDDLPRNGPFVLGALVARGADLAALADQLGVSKQAASQLIDALVSRGYLERAPDPADRRRMTLTVTDRGRHAAERVRGAVGAVDGVLAERVPASTRAGLRAGLAALAELAGEAAPPETPPGPAQRLTRFAPIFGVRDLARALEHYARLGFRVDAYADGDEYGFAHRDGVELHLALQPDMDPLVGAGAAYLFVRDADDLAREWSRPGIGGRLHPPVDTDYRVREGAHIDPDGNLIRFGSRLLGRRPG